MKKMVYLFIVVVFLLCGCSSATSSADGNNAITPSDDIPVDLSYDYIVQLEDFKCYVSYNGNEIIREGTQAKELYSLVSAEISSEHIPGAILPTDNCIYLVFYSGDVEYPADIPVLDFFGTYHIKDDGRLHFSLSPLHSAIFSYEASTDLFNSVYAHVFGESK